MWFKSNNKKIQGNKEYQLAKKFNELKIDWSIPKYYEYESYEKYKYGGLRPVIRKYRPDFYLSQYDMFIGIKNSYNRDKIYSFKIDHYSKLYIMIIEKDNYDLIFTLKNKFEFLDVFMSDISRARFENEYLGSVSEAVYKIENKKIQDISDLDEIDEYLLDEFKQTENPYYISFNNNKVLYGDLIELNSEVQLEHGKTYKFTFDESKKRNNTKRELKFFENNVNDDNNIKDYRILLQCGLKETAEIKYIF